MQVIHCDMEDCKTAEPFSAGDRGLGGPMMLRAPKGWAVIEWQSDGKGEPSRSSKLAAKYFEALTAALPKPNLPGSPDPAEAFRGAGDLLGGSAPELLLTLRAYVCPKCLGERLQLAGSALVGRQMVSDGGGGLFG
jgi:hypothetical protein